MKQYKILKIIVVGIVLILTQNTYAQTTLIPDTNFEQALITLGLDNTLDGQVLTSNINTVTAINVDNMNISDLTGIQDFDSLEFLSCKQNLLTSIDVTQNYELINLDCRLNLLNNIDISQNSELLTLRCSDNSISSIDLSQNTELKYLYCSNNSLDSLNLTQNPNLTNLECNNNGLTDLNISQNPILNIIACNDNQLMSLDFSQNPNLITLHCSNNQLTSLNPGTTSSMGILVCSNNFLTSLNTANLVELESFYCDSNMITSLTLNPQFLQLVNCSYNQLTSLDLSQSNNLNNVQCTNNPSLQYLDLRNNFVCTTLDASDNPILACIIVEDSTINHGTDWQYDTTITQLVETEAACGINLGVSEQNQTIQIEIYPNPTSTHFSIKSPKQISSIMVYNIHGSLVKSFPYQEKYSVEGLSKGIYTIKIEYKQGYEVKLLLIE